MINYAKRFVEVDEILKHLPQELFLKIPNHIIRLIRENKDINYKWSYDKRKKITDQKLHKDTITILSYINTEYLLEGEQRLLMKRFHYFNEMKNKKNG